MLVEALHVSRKHRRDIENGNTDISMLELVQICFAFRCMTDIAIDGIGIRYQTILYWNHRSDRDRDSSFEYSMYE